MWHLELPKLKNVRNTKQKTWHGLRKLVKFKSSLLSLTFVLLSSAKSICSVVATSSCVNMVDTVARFTNWNNFWILSIGTTYRYAFYLLYQNQIVILTSTTVPIRWLFNFFILCSWDSKLTAKFGMLWNFRVIHYSMYHNIKGINGISNIFLLLTRTGGGYWCFAVI